MNTDKQQFAKQLGQTIAKYRQRRDLTQEQLAEILGIGNEAISRIERGVAMPALVRLLELADVFECSVADLLAKSSPRTTDEMQSLSSRLANLSTADRKFVITSMESLIDHLTK